jgi:Cu/Ag efflux pump CusA
MLASAVRTSVRNRLVILAVAVGLLAVGLAALRTARRDAIHEFEPTRVEVQTEALGLSAQEVEQLLTVPLERNFLNGIPFLATIQSQSVPGLSSIELLFEPHTNLFTARQLVQERLSLTSELPNVSRPPQMLQSVSAASRVMMVGLSSKQLSPIELSVLSQFTIRSRLLGVPGVANVSIFGERDLQLQVQVDPQRLKSNGVSLDQVVTTAGNALFVSPLTFLEASTPGSGGFFDTPNQRLGVHHILPIHTPADLAGVPIAESATPIRISDVATVVEDHQPLIGDAALQSGQGLLLVVEKLPGANTQEVTRRVEAALRLLQPGLGDVQVDTSLYRPATLVDTATTNLQRSGMIAALLIALVLLAFWGWGAPIPLLSAAVAIVASAYVLDLRAVTFDAPVVAGLLAAVVMIAADVVTMTAAARQPAPAVGVLGNDGDGVEPMIAAAPALVVGALTSAVGIVAVLLVSGQSGRGFLRPALASYAVAVAMSLVVALTVTPALAAVRTRRRPAVDPGDPGLVSQLVVGLTGSALLHPLIIAAAGTVLLTATGAASIANSSVALRPTFNETEVVIHWDAIAGTSLQEMDRVIARAATEIRAVDGVSSAGTQVGRAVSGDQIVGSNSGELWVNIKSNADHSRTVAALRQIVAGYPGMSTRLSTFFNDRATDLLGRPNPPIIVRLYGEDLDVLATKAAEVSERVRTIPGVDAVRVESVPQQPTIQVNVNLAQAAARGLKPGDIRRSATTLISGLTVGSLYEDQKIFQVVVVGSPDLRASLSTVEDLSIDTPDGTRVRLGDVASVTIGPSPSVITHDNVSRNLDVTVTPHAGDVAGILARVGQAVATIPFPAEHYAKVLSNGASDGSGDLGHPIPAMLGGVLIFLILQAVLNSWMLAGVAFTGVALAVSGALAGSWINGDGITVGSLVGLLAVIGLGVTASLRLFVRLRSIEGSSPTIARRHLVAAVMGERAKESACVAAVLVAAFIPFVLLGHRPGAELVRPLAAAVLGGVVSWTLVTFGFLPAAYLAFAARRSVNIDGSPIDESPTKSIGTP